MVTNKGSERRTHDIAPFVLVPGSEARVLKFVALMDHAQEVFHRRHYLAYTGELDGIPLSVCSTGCGGISVRTILDELAQRGGKTFLRAGVSGGNQPEVQVGDLIIATGAVRLDGSCESLVFREYPAIADPETTMSLVAAAEELGFPYHAGIVASAATFHAGEGSLGYGGYRQSLGAYIRPDLRAARVYDFDNETAALFIFCSLAGLRAGRINVVVDNQETGLFDPSGEDKLIRTALQAIRILADWDRQKTEKHQRFILPPIVEGGVIQNEYGK